MKDYFFAFLLSLVSLQFSLSAAENSNNEVIKPLIENPLPFSKKLPVDLSQSNRKNYTNNPERLHYENEQKISFIRNKSLPWLSFISAFATVLIILYIRMLPSKEIEEQLNPLTKEKLLAEIKNGLQKLLERNPKDDQEAKTSIMQLNTLLRMYLVNQFEVPAFAYTAPDLENKLEKLEGLDAGFKESMIKIFFKVDRIKYAKEKASPEEFIKMVSRKFKF
jgi:hypothetical protein